MGHGECADLGFILIRVGGHRGSSMKKQGMKYVLGALVWLLHRKSC